MRLYHFTSGFHVKQILQAREIRLTDPLLAAPETAAGRADVELADRRRGVYGGQGDGGVVWLTSDPSPKSQQWGRPKTARGLRWVDKTEYRFTVELPGGEPRPWTGWARERGIERRWRKQLMKAGGNAKTWYVLQRPIPTSEWVALERYAADTGKWIPMITRAPGRAERG